MVHDMIDSSIGKLFPLQVKIINGGCCTMTKLNNEVIVAIAGAYEKIGQAHLEIAEYLKALANGFPSIDESVNKVNKEEETKEETKEEASVEVDSQEDGVEEVSEDVEDVTEVKEDVAEEDKSVDENEVAENEVAEEDEEEERSTVLTIETEDGEEEEIDLEEMTLKELKQFAEDYGLEITSKTKKGIIEEILDQIYAEGEEAEEEEAEDVEDDVKEDSEDDVEEGTEEEAEGDGEEEDLAELYGLNDLTLEELAEICAEYGLSTKGKRQALIDRIVRGIKDGTIEVDEDEDVEGE